MKIAVLVKQVPASDNVKMDEETGTMIRSATDAEMNPLDMYAVEEAIRLKEEFEDVHVTVISMGPPQAIDAIKEAISMGCDEGYLVSDRKFAGADTLSTAYTLSATIRHLGDFDIIFSGERATDGETGQVGPSVATQLDIPIVTYVSKIEKVGNGIIRVRRAIEGGEETVEVELPVLLSVVKEINEPRIPNLSGKIKAKDSPIPVLTSTDIDAPLDKIGLSGSPTRVVKVFYPKLSRAGTVIKAKNAELAADEIVKFMKSRGVL
ncbi:electron transfer flavoprotein subunit beta/FixA family protein [Mesoaciditoga lauensis]|uniref:electron transfer flavoprotein subunit beta/FixA family protein n=1 Tax=Mesoaciditoga lauensis TaxID=1495039 RepID=UPI0005639CC8|nr:electron transfer flavoprotein subunit beta/FixA family protein [Mesoaciditoga lauensis]